MTTDLRGFEKLPNVRRFSSNLPTKFMPQDGANEQTSKRPRKVERERGQRTLV